MVSTNPEQITKIDLFLRSSNNDETLIKSLNNIIEKTIEFNWTTIPESGSYKLYASFYDWGGIKKDTNEITININ